MSDIVLAFGFGLLLPPLVETIYGIHQGRGNERISVREFVTLHSGLAAIFFSAVLEARS